jgi:hypothetical protein
MSRSRTARRRYLPYLEALEDRFLPSVGGGHGAASPAPAYHSLTSQRLGSVVNSDAALADPQGQADKEAAAHAVGSSAPASVPYHEEELTTNAEYDDVLPPPASVRLLPSVALRVEVPVATGNEPAPSTDPSEVPGFVPLNEKIGMSTAPPTIALPDWHNAEVGFLDLGSRLLPDGTLTGDWLADEPVTLVVQAEAGQVTVPPSPELLSDLGTASVPIQRLKDADGSSAKEQVSVIPWNSPLAWVTAAMTVTACEIARWQLLRTAREADEEATTTPLGDEFCGLPCGGAP